MSKFYVFNQNNTGGSFETNDMVCHRIFIEAKDAAEANRIALDMGIYFDGVSAGLDCGCCGDRWHEAYGDGISYPYQYGDCVFETPEDHAQHLAHEYGWTTPDARIYYADGKTVKEILSTKRKAA